MSTLASVFFLIITWAWWKPFQEDAPLNLVRRGKTSLEITVLGVDEFISGANSRTNGHLLSLLRGFKVISITYYPRLGPMVLHSGDNFCWFLSNHFSSTCRILLTQGNTIAPRVNMSEVMDLKTQFLCLLMKLIFFVFLIQSYSS